MFKQLTKLKKRATLALKDRLADLEMRFLCWLWRGGERAWEDSRQKLAIFERQIAESPAQTTAQRACLLSKVPMSCTVSATWQYVESDKSIHSLREKRKIMDRSLLEHAKNRNQVDAALTLCLLEDDEQNFLLALWKSEQAQLAFKSKLEEIDLFIKSGEKLVSELTALAESNYDHCDLEIIQALNELDRQITPVRLMHHRAQIDFSRLELQRVIAKLPQHPSFLKEHSDDANWYKERYKYLRERMMQK